MWFSERCGIDNYIHKKPVCGYNYVSEMRRLGLIRLQNLFTPGHFLAAVVRQWFDVFLGRGRKVLGWA